MAPGTEITDIPPSAPTAYGVDLARGRDRCVIVFPDTKFGHLMAGLLGENPGVDVVFSSRIPLTIDQEELPIVKFERARPPKRSVPYWRAHERQLNGRRKR